MVDLISWQLRADRILTPKTKMLLLCLSGLVLCFSVYFPLRSLGLDSFDSFACSFSCLTPSSLGLKTVEDILWCSVYLSRSTNAQLIRKIHGRTEELLQIFVWQSALCIRCTRTVWLFANNLHVPSPGNPWADGTYPWLAKSSDAWQRFNIQYWCLMYRWKHAPLDQWS